MIVTNFKSIFDLLKAFPDEQTCIDHLTKLRWNGNVVSPFHADSKVYVCKNNRYRCKETGRYFNVKTATLFDNTKISLRKWFMAIYLITSHSKGISSVQLSKDIDVTQKTAWFMLQRIRNCFGIDTEMLSNEVEVDETYVGGKNKNRHASKKVPNSQGGKSDDKSPILGMVERQGKVKAKVMEKVNIKGVTKIITEQISTSANLYTDEWIGYKSLSWIYNHAFVKHSAGEYVKGRAHTNTIENFWSLLKRGIFGIYHFTSKKHLQKYVDEFAFRYNTRKSGIDVRFNNFLSQSDRKLTYKQLIHA